MQNWVHKILQVHKVRPIELRLVSYCIRKNILRFNFFTSRLFLLLALHQLLSKLFILDVDVDVCLFFIFFLESLSLSHFETNRFVIVRVLIKSA